MGWKEFAGLVSAAFFGTMIVVVTFKGDDTNTLHTSAQSWCFMGGFVVLIEAGFSKALDLVRDLKGKL